jgi:hypothetical protein
VPLPRTGGGCKLLSVWPACSLRLAHRMPNSHTAKHCHQWSAAQTCRPPRPAYAAQLGYLACLLQAAMWVECLPGCFAHLLQAAHRRHRH